MSRVPRLATEENYGEFLGASANLTVAVSGSGTSSVFDPDGNSFTVREGTKERLPCSGRGNCDYETGRHRPEGKALLMC